MILHFPIAAAALTKAPRHGEYFIFFDRRHISLIAMDWLLPIPQRRLALPLNAIDY